MRVHNIRYKNGGFYLTINNLRSYFNFDNNLGTLTMSFNNINKQNKYYQLWKDIFKIINGGHGELKLHEKIRQCYNVRKNTFACLFSVHNTISLSRHEQVCLMRLRFERYFSHHVASLNILVHDVINLLYYIIMIYL